MYCMCNWIVLCSVCVISSPMNTEGLTERSATTPTDGRPHANATFVFPPRQSTQPQVTLQQSNRQDNQDVLP